MHCMEQRAQEIIVSLKERLPLANHRVIVVCPHFRCLGYLDKEGVWRDDANSRELKDVLGWAEISIATTHFQRTQASD